MSRIGKKPIEIPKLVTVGVEDNFVSVAGPNGELKRKFNNNAVSIAIEEGAVILKPLNRKKESLSLWGTYSSHIRNMIKGVLEGFKKELIIEGIGYRASMEEKNLVLNVGFSHPVKIVPSEGLVFKIDKNTIVISGVDKEKVGEAAARIRSIREPEPYKGKGIRYKNEVIRRKAGKKAATASA